MEEKKKVLLLAGGGTLGSYTALELLKAGCSVDVVCMEEIRSYQKNLRYIRAKIDEAFLHEFLGGRRYDAIVDFLHYTNVKEFPRKFDFLCSRTDRYVFLSSYRVYADEEHPVRETSPQLLDTVGRTGLLARDTYGLTKSENERYIRVSPHKNWTIVRPLISFSRFRFDLVTLGGLHLIPRYLAGKELLLPEEARDKHAALGWAGNVGMLIARLLFAPEAEGEDFIVGNDENLTWEEIAQIYHEVMGLRFRWVPAELYLQVCTGNSDGDRIILLHDRLYDREIDNEKVRRVTHTNREEFVPFREALMCELARLSDSEESVKRFTETEVSYRINRQMDAWFAAHPQSE
ncbi:MAG: hypothetical protein IJR89_02430 [Clostridia bacterium]|nr:hypothetical protein [Clostridia bacterium]